MLMFPKANQAMVRSRRRERQLWSDERANTQSLGCSTCPERSVCGGLYVRAAVFSCSDYCCGTLAGCDRVCRHNAEFVDRVREVGGFELGNVARSSPIGLPPLPRVVPVVFHGSSRSRPFAPDVAGISLYQMCERSRGTPRFRSGERLRTEFKLGPRTAVILSGTANDRPLERWWGFGERRREVIRSLRAVGVTLVTTPNYSLFSDQPRWDDMHSMKRIAIVHEEFLEGGIAAALHVNARTETDWNRWLAYVRARSEVTHLAFEFGTGAGWAERRAWHVRQLTHFSDSVGRPLHLVIRGGADVLPLLEQSFASVTLLETSAFLKTLKRRRAMPTRGGGVAWVHAPTRVGQSLDVLLDHNYRVVQKSLELKWASSVLSTNAVTK